MHTTSPFTDRDAAALDSVVRGLETLEQQRREADAAQIRLFAQALALASPARVGPGTGNGGSERDQAELAYRSVRAELALATRSSEHSIERRLSHAHELTRHYPDTLERLASGAISLAHTEVIVTAGYPIGEDASALAVARRAAYESAALEHARFETPARLRPIARRLATRYAERTLDEQHAEACQQRRVWVTERDDGMSDLSAYLPAVEARAIYDRLTSMSIDLAAQEVAAVGEVAAAGEVAVSSDNSSDRSSDGRSTGRPQRRTRDQLRADILISLLTTTTRDELATGDGGAANGNAGANGNAPSNGNALSDEGTFESGGDQVGSGVGNNHNLGNDRARDGVRAHIQVLVTDRTLFAKTHLASKSFAGIPLAPAELVGAGPISTPEARQLAADAERWELITQHPTTGEIISVDRYRPSEQMRRLLGARDLHCRFPGCSAPLHRCDLDHTLAAADGGSTSTANLAHLCRGHHTLKHHGGWQVRQEAQGLLHWKSPTGRSYVDRPPSKVRFEATAQPGCDPPGLYNVPF